MNFAVVFGASLWSGYALPACHPENGNPRRQPAEVPLIKRENLSRQSRPPLISRPLSTAPIGWRSSVFQVLQELLQAREHEFICRSSEEREPVIDSASPGRCGLTRPPSRPFAPCSHILNCATPERSATSVWTTFGWPGESVSIVSGISPTLECWERSSAQPVRRLQRWACRC